MINTRGWLVVLGAAVLLMTVARAKAEEMNCADIRAIVSMIGEKAAEQRARAAGASEEKIAEAKRCLRAKPNH